MSSIAKEFAAMSEFASDTCYLIGVMAFRDGKPDSACPYLPKEGKGTGTQRMIWMLGYYHARIKPLLDK